MVRLIIIVNNSYSLAHSGTNTRLRQRRGRRVEIPPLTPPQSPPSHTSVRVAAPTVVLYFLEHVYVVRSRDFSAPVVGTRYHLCGYDVPAGLYITVVAIDALDGSVLGFANGRMFLWGKVEQYA